MKETTALLTETLIRSVMGLEEIGPCAVQELKDKAWKTNYPKGKLIYLEGDPPDFVYLIEEGWVKATRLRRDGREQWMRVIGKGDLFGEVAVVADTNYPASVVALEDLTAWIIPGKVLKSLMSDLTFASGMARRASRQVLQFARLAEDLSLKSIEERLVTTLIQYAEFQNGAWQVPRREWTTFDEMASRLGTVRDVLGRSLRALEKDEVIRVEKQKIVILNTNRFLEIGGLS